MILLDVVIVVVACVAAFARMICFVPSIGVHTYPCWSDAHFVGVPGTLIDVRRAGCGVAARYTSRAGVPVSATHIVLVATS